jgi:hypothetical protein
MSAGRGWPAAVLAALLVCPLACSGGPAPVAPLSHVRQISLGALTTMAIGSDGRVWKWEKDTCDEWTEWKGVGAPAALTGDSDSRCLLTVDGVAACGELREPEVASIAGARDGDSPQGDVCLIKRTGQVLCTFFGLRPELVPVPALGVESKALSFGPDGGCAQKQDGAIRCWGNLNPGQPRRGTDDPIVWLERPELGTDLTQFEVNQAGDFACGVSISGRVTCWGRMSSHDFGDDNVKVAVAGQWWALLKKDGSVWTFGDGRLAGFPLAWDAPALMEGLPGRAVDIAIGHNYLCAELADATAWCRGEDNGQRSVGPPVFGAAPLRGCAP